MNGVTDLSRFQLSCIIFSILGYFRLLDRLRSNATSMFFSSTGEELASSEPAQHTYRIAILGKLGPAYY